MIDAEYGTNETMSNKWAQKYISEFDSELSSLSNSENLANWLKQPQNCNNSRNYASSYESDSSSASNSSASSSTGSSSTGSSSASSNSSPKIFSDYIEILKKYIKEDGEIPSDNKIYDFFGLSSNASNHEIKKKHIES